MIATLEAPHPDIELGVERSRLRYLLRAPDAGLDRHTGLVVFVAGYGMDPLGAYAEKLTSHLANRHNLIAVSVDYFGANLSAKGTLQPQPDFFRELEKHYGTKVSSGSDVDVTTFLRSLAALLRGNGITFLHEGCRLARVAGEYNSMGFLPALDNLRVVQRVLAEHSLDRRRLFVIGTSYGGYIAGLMAKLAPETFRLVVDNSGFSSPADDFAGVFGQIKTLVEGVAMRTQVLPAWSSDPAAPNHFSRARFALRSLLEEQHVFPNTARIYAYHAPGDTVAPTERKLRLRQVYAGRAAYDLTVIDERVLDGRIFKTLEHGMRASLRGLFDLSYEKYLAAGGALADHTDFDLAGARRFRCEGEDYVLRFSREHGVAAAIRATVHALS